MTGGRVEVISSKGCSRLIIGAATSLPAVARLRSMDILSSASACRSEASVPSAGGPFSGLVICVTGLSKEARKEVMAATERLGGQYSASLHPQCSHLVVQSFSGRKFEHALKHGSKSGLLIVTLGWFVDSVRKNVRLSESLYSVKSVGENGLPSVELNRLAEFPGSEKSCLPIAAFDNEKYYNRLWQPRVQPSNKELTTSRSIFSNDFIYVDSEISHELKKKVVGTATREGATFLDQWFVGCPATYVVCEGPSIRRYLGYTNNLVTVVGTATREGATFLDQWFVGCPATYVVCEGPSIRRYLGYTNNLVTPLWILKAAKEKSLQRLVHLSSDLARQVNIILENSQIAGEDNHGGNAHLLGLNSNFSIMEGRIKENFEDRQKTADLAKLGVRQRRGHRMQIPIHPITPSNLLESICWSVSEPTSSVRIYAETSCSEDANEQHTSNSNDARGANMDSEALIDNFSRSLRESEKHEVILKSHFLTILFPVDRFGELGPSSRTYFSDGGFTCIQVLDFVYNFYQENMSAYEVEVAIHSDSRHADRLRLLYASKESAERGFVVFKRIDFLGSRRSFETLKRLNGENNNNVYELIIRA